MCVRVLLVCVYMYRYALAISCTFEFTQPINFRLQNTYNFRHNNKPSATFTCLFYFYNFDEGVRVRRRVYAKFSMPMWLPTSTTNNTTLSSFTITLSYLTRCWAVGATAITSPKTGLTLAACLFGPTNNKDQLGKQISRSRADLSFFLAKTNYFGRQYDQAV